MEIWQIILVLIVAFLAGMDGTLDSFQFHQPIVAATLIGIVTGHPTEGIILGGTLQMITLGWMNIGAAVAPDAALASVASAIMVTTAGMSVQTGIAVAIPLAVAGLFLTTIVRTLMVPIMHVADRMGEEGNLDGVVWVQRLSIFILGLRIAIPAAFIIALPVSQVRAALNALPEWLTNGLAVAGGFIVVVGYAMVINMMASAELWPFFALGFALSAVTDLNLIAMGVIGVVLALLYLQLSPKFNGGSGNGGGGSNGPDQLDVILNDY
jgi:PTS system mannose-specific IIC component